MLAMSCCNHAKNNQPLVIHCAIRQRFIFSGLSFVFSSIYRDIIIQIKYSENAATQYPTIDFTSTFSNTTVVANADKTRNVVDTGMPTRVSNSNTTGAIA